MLVSLLVMNYLLELIMNLPNISTGTWTIDFRVLTYICDRPHD